MNVHDKYTLDIVSYHNQNSEVVNPSSFTATATIREDFDNQNEYKPSEAR